MILYASYSIYKPYRSSLHISRYTKIIYKKHITCISEYNYGMPHYIFSIRVFVNDSLYTIKNGPSMLYNYKKLDKRYYLNCPTLCTTRIHPYPLMYSNIMFVTDRFISHLHGW